MDQQTSTSKDCFTRFQKPIDSISLPQRFTYPFYYEPHPLCLLAVEQLQNHIKTQNEWIHDFGIGHFVDGVNVGKMFGVLVVQKKKGEIGFLSAFSGKLADQNVQPGFVPPVADYLKVDGFFRQGEQQIEKINSQVEGLENDPDFLNFKAQLESETKQAEHELAAQQSHQRQTKIERKKAREQAQTNLSGQELQDVLTKLDNQSKKDHFDKKDLKRKWDRRLLKLKEQLNSYSNELDHLKKLRKQKSATLQQQIFNQYQFLNKAGEKRSVSDIFKETAFKIPPSGAGDCAMPKLLQYAFQSDLKPIAMAEFWWGQSPRSEIRKHSHFYPSCKGKCEPILSHMLKGIELEESPLMKAITDNIELEVVYEDDHLLVVNKPHEFLSVPGKTNADSVMSRMQKAYPEATGPMMVHRLDRATSGLMLVAKSKEIHEQLQKQFLDKTIQKRYVALLDGIVPEDQGIIDLPLRPDIEDRPRQLVDFEHGKSAKTKYKVLERSNGQTLIHFWPITGRTHQLRMHAAHHLGLNVPIVGDDLYGKPGSRLHLHAEAIEFVHPVKKKAMRLAVDIDFKGF